MKKFFRGLSLLAILSTFLIAVEANLALGQADESTEALEPFPATADGHMKRGYAAAKQKDYASAILYFEQARALTPNAPEIYYNLGLAESKIPGRELRAVVWFGAYLDKDPGAANAALVKKQMRALCAKNQSNLSILLNLAEDAAAQIFQTLGNKQGEELTYRGDILIRDKKSNNLQHVARLWAESGDITAALKTAGRFRRTEYRRNTLGDIAGAQAATGDIPGAQQTAEILDEPNLKSWIQLGIVEAYVRNGDIAAAQETVEVMQSGVSKEWAQYAITNGKAMVPGRYDAGDKFNYHWLSKLEDNDQTHNCPLNSAPFLDLPGYLKSLSTSSDPQVVFDALRRTADKLIMAQLVIDRMMKEQAALSYIPDSPEQENNTAEASTEAPAIPVTSDSLTTKNTVLPRPESAGSANGSKTSDAKEYTYQGRQITLAPELVFDITGKVEKAQVTVSEYGSGSDFCVDVVLKDNVKQAFHDFTEKNIGQEVGLVYNARLLLVAVMQGPIPFGNVQISGGIHTIEEAEKLAAELSSK